jgi:hypothetical protein
MDVYLDSGLRIQSDAMGIRLTNEFQDAPDIEVKIPWCYVTDLIAALNKSSHGTQGPGYVPGFVDLESNMPDL